MNAQCSGRSRSLVPRGGKEGGNDHILTAKRHDLGRAIHVSTVIPCRDPTSGIRHPFDLVTPAAPFKRRVH